MIRLKILAGVGDKFPVGRMVDGLNARDLGTQRRHMSFDMLDEFNFGICRSCDQDGTRIGDGLCHALQKLLILRRVAAANAVGLVVNVARGIVREQHEVVDPQGDD